MVWLMGKDEIEVEMPDEWGGIVPTEVFFQNAKQIVEEAQKRNIIIRVIGGMGIRMHSGEFDELAQKLTRLEGEQEFTDLDFMTYQKYQKKVLPRFFEEFGKQVYGKPFIKRRTTISSATTKRHIFYHPKGWYFIDMFYEILKFNHDIHFKDRLEIDPLTISVTDLLLGKLQITEVFSGKDLKDSILLFRAHDVQEGIEENAINATYISELMAKDWGFYYSVTENLKGIKEFAPGIDALSESDITNISAKIDKLLEIIDAVPKGMRWKARAKVGTKKQWYRPVETDATVSGMSIWNLKETVK